MTSEGLAAVRQELDCIREGLCTARFTHAGAFELKRRLETAVSHFQAWTGSGEALEQEAIEEIQRQLAALQPLFDNAYQLQSGWYELATGGSGYDSGGKTVDGPAAASAPEIAVVG